MDDDSPFDIQQALPHRTSAPPLVLLHDGGGTTFDYHFIDDLDRQVWGISNPVFDTDKSWAGGIPEMATHYIKQVREVVPAGPIILGGWSLGGLLSIEMARQLVGDPKLVVKGIVMVDSVFPEFEAPGMKVVGKYEPKLNAFTRESTQKAVNRCFDQAFDMVKTWKIPEWEDVAPPPTVLLRVRERTPVPEHAEPGSIMRVDLNRDLTLVGWEKYKYRLIDAVSYINGHHYNPFKMENVDLTSTKIKAACYMIERGQLTKAADNDSVVRF